MWHTHVACGELKIEKSFKSLTKGEWGGPDIDNSSIWRQETSCKTSNNTCFHFFLRLLNKKQQNKKKKSLCNKNKRNRKDKTVLAVFKEDGLACGLSQWLYMKRPHFYKTLFLFFLLYLFVIFVLFISFRCSFFVFVVNVPKT